MRSFRSVCCSGPAPTHTGRCRWPANWGGQIPGTSVPFSQALRQQSPLVGISFDLLRIEKMPDLQAQFSWAHDSWTLKKLVALRSPSNWSEIIIAFIGRLWRPFGFGSSWDVRDALGFIASSGGQLVSVSPDQINYLRHVLLKVQETDAFVWLLRWLKNERHCAPAIYEEVTRTASMRQKIEALNAGGRYPAPSSILGVLWALMWALRRGIAHPGADSHGKPPTSGGGFLCLTQRFTDLGGLAQKPCQPLCRPLPYHLATAPEDR
jgi:hypothetical protein